MPKSTTNKLIKAAFFIRASWNVANANRGRKCADEGCGGWKDDTERTELVVEGGWGCQMAKFDPPRPPPWLNPKKGRDQILQRSVAGP